MRRNRNEELACNLIRNFGDTTNIEEEHIKLMVSFIQHKRAFNRLWKAMKNNSMCKADVIPECCGGCGYTKKQGLECMKKYRKELMK